MRLSVSATRKGKIISMTELLEIREKIKLFYSRFETFILPLAKFLLAFVVLSTLNSGMSYMGQLDNVALVLIVALTCSFLPTGAIVFFGMLFSLLHMYALSVEVALAGLCMYLLMYLLFFRFSLKDSLVVVLTPLLFALHIPYVVPIAVGLVCGPASIISVGCGVAVHYLLQAVTDNASTISTMSDDADAAMAKLRMMIDAMIGNREMMVMIAAFSITILTVYLIRRLSIDYAWTIAMVSGALIDIVILLIGDLIYDINTSIVSALLGSLLALAAAKVIEFFRFCVDYSRTEKVQFEDDEYYYYVKAVPKMSVSMSTKTVKKINTQHTRNGAGRGAGSGYQARNPQAQRSGTGRRVTTERTGDRRGYGTARSTVQDDRRRSRSVTIGNTDQNDGADGSEDFEELY